LPKKPSKFVSFVDVKISTFWRVLSSFSMSSTIFAPGSRDGHTLLSSRTCPPNSAFVSTRKTSIPILERKRAAERPETPPPMTRADLLTSTCFSSRGT